MLIKNLCTKNYEKILLKYAKELGYILSYKGERNGEMIHNIYSEPMKQYEKSSFGSKIPLSFHTEMAFHNIVPSYILLFCLHSDPNCKTFIIEQYNILSQLDLISKNILEKKLFKIYPPISYTQLYKPKWKPILNNSVFSFANHCKTEYKNQNAMDAYNNLIDICEKNKSSIILEKGDLLIINNKTQIHGRSDFNSESKRLLKRMYIYSYKDFYFENKTKLEKSAIIVS
jgi:L-asparagine oxygenase